MTDRQRLAATLLALLACLTPACSSGGGGSDEQPITPTRCISYASATPTAGEVGGRQGAGSACGMLALEIVVAGVSDVFGARLDINYDPGLMTFDSVSDTGSFLKSDGATTQAQAPSGPSGGKVTVGITRVGVTDGIDFPAPGQLLMTVFFRRATNAAGSAPVTFTNADLIDSGAPPTPPQPIPGVTWINGTATVQ